MSGNNWKFTNAGFKGFTPEMWKRRYETWLILKEMGHELLMTFYPNGDVMYGTPGIHDDTDAENAAVKAAMDEWDRRNSSFLENVQALVTLPARASVETEVVVGVTEKRR